MRERCVQLSLSLYLALPPFFPCIALEKEFFVFRRVFRCCFLCCETHSFCLFF